MHGVLELKQRIGYLVCPVPCASSIIASRHEVRYRNADTDVAVQYCTIEEIKLQLILSIRSGHQVSGLAETRGLEKLFVAQNRGVAVRERDEN
jgi:hypothetical protein